MTPAFLMPLEIMDPTAREFSDGALKLEELTGAPHEYAFTIKGQRLWVHERPDEESVLDEAWFGGLAVSLSRPEVTINDLAALAGMVAKYEVAKSNVEADADG